MVPWLKDKKDDDGFLHFQSENDNGLFQTDNSYHHNQTNIKDRGYKNPITS